MSKSLADNKHKAVNPASAPLTPQQCAGRLIMIRLQGTSLDIASADFLRTKHIRAVCLFRQNMVNEQQLRQFTSDLRAVMGPDALIALDQEGGAVVRSAWLPEPPSAMALGASADTQLCFNVGAAVARGVKSLGFNWNFAPVLDVNNNPDNPVIAERSFGSDPDMVSKLALSWMAGSLSEGVACCVKHFPGHGDTNVDSHRALPTVSKSRAGLDALELAPFRTAANHPDTPAMMTAHIIYPALDAGNPATLSHPILTGLLREEWGYQGVIITDSMDMHAIARHYGVANAAVMALSAGADMVMALGDHAAQLATLSGLSDAISSGQITDVQVTARLTRLDKLAQRYPCSDSVYSAATEANDRQLMALAWQRGLTPFRQPAAPAANSKVRLVMRQDTVSDGVSEAGISAGEVLALLQSLYETELVTYADAEQFDWASLPKDGRTVILASNSRRRYGSRAKTTWHPDLHLALWSPFQALDIAAPTLISYGFAPPAMAGVADWLAGKLILQGQIPVAGFHKH